MLRKKSRGSDPDNSYITSFSATVVISGASFIPMLAYPKMPLVLESRISRVARTQGPAVRQRSEPRRQCVQGNVGEPIGRANLVAKGPAVANGRAAHARSSFSYAARIVTARPVAQPVAEADYCSETWSEWQDLNLTLSDASVQHRRLTIAKTAFYLSGFVHSGSS